jgi:hypothetical protein
MENVGCQTNIITLRITLSLCLSPTYTINVHTMFMLQAAAVQMWYKPGLRKGACLLVCIWSERGIERQMHCSAVLSKMALTQVSSNKCAGGYQKVYEHERYTHTTHAHAHV